MSKDTTKEVTPAESKVEATVTPTEEKEVTVIEPAELSADMVKCFDGHIANLAILMKAEDKHELTSKDLIEMFEESRKLMVSAKIMLKANIPTALYEALRIRLDANDKYSTKLVTRAKKELAVITAYFNLGLSMRIRDIKFALFSKVIQNAKTDSNPMGITKSAISAALNKKDIESYTKALEDLVVKAEYAKLVGEINMALVPASIQDAVNTMDSKTMAEVAKYVKMKSSKGAPKSTAKAKVA